MCENIEKKKTRESLPCAALQRCYMTLHHVGHIYAHRIYNSFEICKLIDLIILLRIHFCVNTISLK